MSSPGSIRRKAGGAAAARGGGSLAGIVIFLAVALVVVAAVLLRPATPAVEPRESTLDTATMKAAITLDEQPLQSVSGKAIQPAPAVLVTDFKGRPVAGVSVSAVLQPGAFASGSHLHATTDAEGRAVFDALKVERAGAYRVAFTANGYSPAQSAEFVVRFGIPRALSIVSEPQSGVAGAPVQGEPSVRVTDESGNPVPGINIDLSLEAAGAGERRLATMPSDAAGLAVFRDIVIDSPGTAYRLKFDARAAGVNNAISNPFNLTNS